MSLPIITDRLILRKVEQSDLEGMYNLDSTKEVHRYLGEGWMNESIDDAQKNIDSIISQYKERGIGRWTAIERSSGKFIGWSGLKLNTEVEMNGHKNFYDIGYRLLPEFWGKGYATESSIASLKYGFEILGLKNIYGITHIDNEASHRVLLKTGLEHTTNFYHPDEPFELRWYELNKNDYMNSLKNN